MPTSKENMKPCETVRKTAVNFKVPEKFVSLHSHSGFS